MTRPADRAPTASGAAVFALLLLADGRFPAGGHAHSSGAEAAVADGRIADIPTLEAFVLGRILTAGLVEAAIAAAAARHLSCCGSAAELGSMLRRLDVEAAARISAPPLRDASRRLGRQLVRAAGGCWPDARLAAAAEALPDGIHLPVALGAVGAVAGLGPVDVARLALHHAITMPAQAALRLLALDPFAVAGLVARLAPVAEEVALDAVAAAAGPIEDLPARSAPIVEIAAVAHQRLDARMFAS